jgi:hypothetical protein
MQRIGEMLAHHDRVERTIGAALWFMTYAGATPFRRSDVIQSLVLRRWRPRLSMPEIIYATDQAFDRWLAAGCPKRFNPRPRHGRTETDGNP